MKVEYLTEMQKCVVMTVCIGGVHGGHIPNGVYRSLIIRGLLHRSKNGYLLTEDGLNEVRKLVARAAYLPDRQNDAY